MIKVILEELRYCTRGTYQHGYLVDEDTMEFERDEGFKGGESFDTVEEAIAFAKKVYKNLWGLKKRLCRLAVIEETSPEEDEYEVDEEELWSSEELPIDY